jgi:hypothetical protein
MDAVAASRTTGAEEDGYVQHWSRVTVSLADQVAIYGVWPGVRPGGPPKAEPGR